MIQITFILIKPDAIERKLVGEIISRLEKIGRITKIDLRIKGYVWYQDHYKDLFNRESSGDVPQYTYEKNKVFLVNHPLIGIMLIGESIIEKVRKIIGSTNPLEAKPGTIRGDFGNSQLPKNLIHAADSPENVIREINLFFSDKNEPIH